MKDIEFIRKENNEQEKSLFHDNKILLTDMAMYLLSSNLCDYDVEIIRKDLIGMALEAQLNGESFSSAIGEDYKEFCDKLILIGDKKLVTKKILENLSNITIVIGFMFVVEIFIYFLQFSAFKNVLLKFNMPLTWGFILPTLLIIIGGYGWLTFIKKNSFSLSDENSRKTTTIFGLVFMLSFFLIGILKVLLRNSSICTINYLYFLIAIIVAYTIIILLKKLLQNKTVNKY